MFDYPYICNLIIYSILGTAIWYTLFRKKEEEKKPKQK